MSHKINLRYTWVQIQFYVFFWHAASYWTISMSKHVAMIQILDFNKYENQSE